MSVVAALTEWLVHTNRGPNGAWSQRYAHGEPVTDLVPIDDDETSGTTVLFLPDVALRRAPAVTTAQLSRLTVWPHLAVEVIDERNS